MWSQSFWTVYRVKWLGPQSSSVYKNAQVCVYFFAVRNQLCSFKYLRVHCASSLKRNISRPKRTYSCSWETLLRATGRHLLYGITQCYLPPDTSERAPLKLQPVSWYSIYLPRRNGRLSWSRSFCTYQDGLQSPIQAVIAGPVSMDRGDWKCKTWTMQDLQNDGPRRRGWQMQDLQKWRNKSQGWQCKTSDWVARRFT